MEEYRLVLKSQLGPREGMLRVDVQQDAVAGSLTLLGDENPVSGVQIGEHTFRLFHHLHTAGLFSCPCLFLSALSVSAHLKQYTTDTAVII